MPGYNTAVAQPAQKVELFKVTIARESDPLIVDR